MDLSVFIDEQVYKFYWEEDYNCATTSLKTLSAIYNIQLSSQVIDAAQGMHGAGKYGAQCGLVEGCLMFIGIYGTHIGLEQSVIVKTCYDFAESFEEHFRSIRCSDLRPGGFQKTDPPHLCEALTKKALLFSVDHLNNVFIHNKIEIPKLNN
ncbi:C-GCAxxG-C-C family protein [Cellulosilyticum sp. I15G10I2]|uniref:C-GCAxxG-C-C family protein n=1 Tax=Cellulosilyticum sp. I15G10I2 TaxID=1892843 RepID=UPI00085CD8BD|nr:C-GCAxxG-C-C family protein [Cellulosilyticum sp. I15G10I2]